MKNYTSIDELPISLTVNDVATVLGVSRNIAYQLTNSEGFPTLRIGKRIVIPKMKLVEWMSEPKAIVLYKCITGYGNNAIPGGKECRDMAKKARANGEGCIRKRKDGRWLVEIQVGIKADGRPNKIYKYTKSKADAAVVLKQLHSEMLMGVERNKGGITVSEWCSTWITKYKKKLAASTRASYETNLRVHINKHIGGIQLKNCVYRNIRTAIPETSGHETGGIRTLCRLV